MRATDFRYLLERLEAALHRYMLRDRPAMTPALQRVLSAKRVASDQLAGHARAQEFVPGRGVPGFKADSKGVSDA